MLKKYTKYVATAFAVASLSTFMIGCAEEGDTGPVEEPPSAPPEESDIPGEEGTEGTEGE
jgi:hypothetical protein